MNEAKVSKLTKEELALANAQKATEMPAADFSGEQIYRGDFYSTEFIKKLKLSEIEKFFERYDITACAKIPNEQDPKFVMVSCKGFNVVFSDYSFVFDFNGGLVSNEQDSKSKFDMAAFLNYCELTEQTPDQVIAETMAVELFGQRFSSYAPRRREIKQKEAGLAFKALPKEMQKALGTAHESYQHSIDSTYNKNYFGTYSTSQTETNS